MGKSIKRTIGFLAILALILGAVRTFFLWIARSEESQDSYEVFEDEEQPSKK
jgi:hypothetical protein